jgi:hypothetical protein
MATVDSNTENIHFSVPAAVLRTVNSVQASTALTPVTWSIDEPNLGCMIDQEGRITIGNQFGHIHIRATLDAGCVSFERELSILSLLVTRPARSHGLPFSVPLNGVSLVSVSVQPPLSAENGLNITFRAEGCSTDHGIVEVLEHEPLHSEGVVQLRGLRQNHINYRRQLGIHPILNGVPLNFELHHLEKFGVCAHPSGVENIFLGIVQDPTANRYGLQVRIDVQSDSGNAADLDAVEIQEVVSGTRDTSASLVGMPVQRSDQGGPQNALEPIYDTHALYRRNVIDNLRYLNGNSGHWCNDQLDIFTCARCNPPRSVAVPNSGHRVIREITLEGEGRVRLIVRKLARACEVDGNGLSLEGQTFNSEAGLSGTLAADCGLIEL